MLQTCIDFVPIVFMVVDNLYCLIRLIVSPVYVADMTVNQEGYYSCGSRANRVSRVPMVRYPLSWRTPEDILGLW